MQSLPSLVLCLIMGIETILAAALMLGFTWHTHTQHEQLDRLEEIEQELEVQDTTSIEYFNYRHYEDRELP